MSECVLCENHHKNYVQETKQNKTKKKKKVYLLLQYSFL